MELEEATSAPATSAPAVKKRTLGDRKCAPAGQGTLPKPPLGKVFRPQQWYILVRPEGALLTPAVAIDLLLTRSSTSIASRSSPRSPMRMGPLTSCCCYRILPADRSSIASRVLDRQCGWDIHCWSLVRPVCRSAAAIAPALASARQRPTGSIGARPEPLRRFPAPLWGTYGPISNDSFFIFKFPSDRSVSDRSDPIVDVWIGPIASSLTSLFLLYGARWFCCS